MKNEIAMVAALLVPPSIFFEFGPPYAAAEGNAAGDLVLPSQLDLSTYGCDSINRIKDGRILHMGQVIEGTYREWFQYQQSDQDGGRLVCISTVAPRQEMLDAIASGQALLVVGTHAVIQQDVHFHRLGLAIIDEQHRFGVEQRQALMEKGTHPDVLVMTATPCETLSRLTMLRCSIVCGITPSSAATISIR